MKKQTLIIAAILAVVALAATPFIYAEGPNHWGHHDGVFMFGRLSKVKEALGLSDQQVTDIQAIVQQTRQQNKPYRDQLRGGFKSITSTLLANPNDVATAQQQLDQQEAAEKAIKTNMLTAASKALNVLTPDQRTKLADLLAKRQQHSQNPR